MDACFSGASLAIVGTLLTALSGAIAAMFKVILADRDEWRRLALRGTEVADKALTVADTRGGQR